MKHRKFEDDGHTVANMNVEGFSWYRPEHPEGDQNLPSEWTSDQSRAALGGILKAALLICAVFAVGYFLFLLFCDKIWFR